MIRSELSEKKKKKNSIITNTLTKAIIRITTDLFLESQETVAGKN
jgi:hypothetical protein